MEKINRKQFIKGASCSLAAIGLLNFSPSVSASSANQKVDEKNAEKADEIRQAYFASKDFLAHYEDNPEDALNMLDRIIAQLTSHVPTTYAYAEIYSVNVNLVQQPNSYTCGPASSYMAITGFGQTSNILGASVNDKIYRLATEMGTTSDGTMVYRVRNGLNQYVANTSTSSHTYKYYLGTQMSQTDFCNSIVRSLGYGRVPLLHAKTQSLPYYNGNDSGHYIAISQFNGNNMTVQLKDPNSNNSYYGTKTVSVADAFASINAHSNRYLIACGV